MQEFINVDNLSFAYEESNKTLFDKISLKVDTGWSCIVGPNGCGKTTLLKLLCGLLQPDSGNLGILGKAYYSEQRTDFKPKELDSFFNSTEKSAYKIKELLQIEDNWQFMWNNLSHGERKRCQIAVALFEEPTILAIDEPSNHLDNKSKKILLNSLKSFRGIGLLVSHDRELMDNLCNRTIFINPPNIVIRKCNYTTAVSEIELENKSRADEYISAKREIKKLKKKVEVQKQKNNRSAKMGSKRNISPKDHDAKSKMDLARLTGKDGIEGRKYKKMQNQLTAANNHKNSIDYRKKTELGISFNTEKNARFFPITIPSSEIKLGEEKILKFPELTIQQGDKIGIIGDNGSGKSTFVNYFFDTVNIKSDMVIYIPQEITIEQSQLTLERIKNYKNVEKGQIMTIISRLGSDPKHLLETVLPTPGEVRKIILAEGIMSNPGIIIMDEPTNHMDLPSVECIEDALNECPCSQLLVSHDIQFLKNTASYYWSFERMNDFEYQVTQKFSI